MSKKFKTLEQGFTLLEVMVAIAILGIGLLVILQLFSEGLRSVSTSDDYTAATIYAKERMAEALTSSELTATTKEGLSENSKFQWKVEVTPYPMELLRNNLPFSIYRIKVAITWPGRLGKKGIELETLKTVAQKQ